MTDSISYIHLLHCRFKSTVKSVNFTPNSLFLGLHETHLQFIVWKEMLGSIKPGEDTSYPYVGNTVY